MSITPTKMVSTPKILVIFLTILLFQKKSLGQPACQMLSLPSGNKTLELSVVGHRNQSGHWMTEFTVNTESPQPQRNWKMDLKHTIEQYHGENTIHIKGALIVPPSRPLDYELFPGVGYYKFHHEDKATFQEASSICTNEGGHLAIINSQEEADVLKTLFQRHHKNAGPWSFIGMYLPQTGQEFITIFGQPLKETGFLKWHPGNPNGGNEYCGCFVHSTVTIGDINCADKLAFFCEYDLSWGK
ncbi:hemolymph lipopolysaccharide-binding protein-like [Ischnura elegans]|uniref:hemolymph lipopolysaccharide-binding protein-like n=1 Tax=Ischnura elegans TaxID=197161 RepID=UPI001ED8B108|nr:hemolymph lipopolysaccharide-binding protein-like [Ischnura elegans]